ncbi:hypothetical protein FAM21835_02497 [Lentilactobacillus parabuchneri]|uniref:Cap15 family cyclic dinucleotide receptor domain-containing protein n=1 Tax=Lentilactobacillus parabuchneri TaxID=152331 RepID=UPI000A11DCD0|nr:hypothetical protein [Lentilactobacillus parabuchneri]ORN24435.1 hypothetical protein FAM21835_02497 [Lentilactobacillus parabuchneri]
MSREQKSLINITTYAVIVISVVLCFVRNSQVKMDDIGALLGNVGDSVAGGATFSVLYEHLLWKFNPLEPHPRLSSIYQGNVLSTYDGKTRCANFEISQTLMSTKVRFSTDESKSDAVMAKIIEINDRPYLVYSYQNTPQAQFRENSPMHYGTAFLEIIGKSKLEGDYFTDRKTTGHIVVIGQPESPANPQKS